jgi:hypothetical protein
MDHRRWLKRKCSRAGKVLKSGFANGHVMTLTVASSRVLLLSSRVSKSSRNITKRRIANATAKQENSKLASLKISL